MPPAWYYACLGQSYRLTEQYDKAIDEYEKGLRVVPDNSFCLLGLAETYSLAGRQEDARKTAAQLLRLSPKFSVEAWAKIYKDPAVQEQMINALRKAGLN
jgi:tetratricopeptide (TPR) repeat protein